MLKPIWRFWLRYNDHLLPWHERKTSMLILLAPAAALMLGYIDLAFNEGQGWNSYFIPVAGVACILTGVWLGAIQLRVYLRLARQRHQTRRTYTFDFPRE